jgi:hypothetical protein
MRRFRYPLLCLLVMASAGGFPGAAVAAPMFSECSAVGADSGCQFLITVSSLGTSLATDPSQPSFANNDAATDETGTPTDALIGVRNDTKSSLGSLSLTGSDVFGFDGDGVCDNASGPAPTGCQTPAGSTSCGAFDGGCSFPPPPGEPANYRESGAPAGWVPFGNGDVQNGYEGPTTWYSNVTLASNVDTGTVNFSPPVPPGGSTYFGLEAEPDLPLATSVALAQAEAGVRGRVLYLPSGVRIQSSAELLGGAAKPTGSIAVRLFRTARCSGRSVAAGTIPVPASHPVSKAVLLSQAGIYYWQGQYTGNSTSAASVSACGSQRVVVPKTAAVGLPSSERCVSELSAQLKVAGHSARAAEVFANNKLVARFRSGTIRVPVRRTAKIAVIASSVKNAFARGLTAARYFRQQTVTYHAC